VNYASKYGKYLVSVMEAMCLITKDRNLIVIFEFQMNCVLQRSSFSASLFVSGTQYSAILIEP